MDARMITPRYSVSPQISAEDVPAIVAAGFKTVVCNRPDEEVPPSHQATAIQSAVEAAGLAFKVLPLTHQTMTEENINAQRGYYDECEGPVLAYCASGTRCTVIWALGQAREVDVNTIMTAALEAGYDLSGLRPTLEAIAAN